MRRFAYCFLPCTARRSNSKHSKTFSSPNACSVRESKSDLRYAGIVLFREMIEVILKGQRKLRGSFEKRKLGFAGHAYSDPGVNIAVALRTCECESGYCHAEQHNGAERCAHDLFNGLLHNKLTSLFVSVRLGLSFPRRSRFPAPPDSVPCQSVSCSLLGRSELFRHLGLVGRAETWSCCKSICRERKQRRTSRCYNIFSHCSPYY